LPVCPLQFAILELETGKWREPWAGAIFFCGEKDHSAQQLEDLAGAFDHLLLLVRGIEELNSVGEAVTISNNAPKYQLCCVVGNHKFQLQTAAKRQLTSEKQAHTAPADVGSLSTKTMTLTLKDYRDIHGDNNRLSFPSAVVFVSRWRRLDHVIWFRKFHSREATLICSPSLHNLRRNLAT
jgi:hypothetical protein